MFVLQYVSIPRINRFYLDSQPTIQRFPLKVLAPRMLSWFLRCRFLRVWGRFLLQLGGQPVPQGAHQVTSSSPGLLGTSSRGPCSTRETWLTRKKKNVPKNKRSGHKRFGKCRRTKWDCRRVICGSNSDTQVSDRSGEMGGRAVSPDGGRSKVTLAIM